MKNTKKKASKITDSRLGITAFVIAISFAVGALIVMLVHINKPLLGPHSFRQTTTALSAFHMLGEPKIFADYITPVLGPPWAIPMEVPFYQWVVSRITDFTSANLDSVGQAVSTLALFLCIIPMCLLIINIGVTRPVAALTCAICLSSPLYLFWGRAFMIETTGLLLSLGMVASALISVSKRSWVAACVALAIGIAASLCKATTWAVAAGVGILLVAFIDGRPSFKNWKYKVVALVALTAPIFPAKLWLAWGDSVKEKNPFASELIISSSPNQAAWNFGTLEQKLDPTMWVHIWRHVTDQILVPFPIVGHFFLLAILLIGGVFAPRRIPILIALVAGFVAGPVIFTNLYFEHSYYWCANGVWLLLAVGVALGCIWDYNPNAQWPKLLTIALASSVCISGFISWHNRFFPVLEALPSHEKLADIWTRPVQAVVPSNRTILILGNDWNPNSLYYAERKGIAFPTADWIPLPGPQLDESLANLGPDERLGAVVVNEQLLNPGNQAFFADYLQKLGMSSKGQRTAFGILFPARDLGGDGRP